MSSSTKSEPELEKNETTNKDAEKCFKDIEAKQSSIEESSDDEQFSTEEMFNLLKKTDKEHNITQKKTHPKPTSRRVTRQNSNSSIPEKSQQTEKNESYGPGNHSTPNIICKFFNKSNEQQEKRPRVTILDSLDESYNKGKRNYTPSELIPCEARRPYLNKSSIKEIDVEKNQNQSEEICISDDEDGVTKEKENMAKSENLSDDDDVDSSEDEDKEATKEKDNTANSENLFDDDSLDDGESSNSTIPYANKSKAKNPAQKKKHGKSPGKGLDRECAFMQNYFNRSNVSISECDQVAPGKNTSQITDNKVGTTSSSNESTSPQFAVENEQMDIDEQISESELSDETNQLKALKVASKNVDKTENKI